MSQSQHRHARRLTRILPAVGLALVWGLAAQALAPHARSSSRLAPRGAATLHHAAGTAPASLSPLPHRAAGAGTIVQNGQAPFPALLYSIQNHWYEVKGGVTVIVYAGAERQDSLQGLVIVEEASAGYTRIAGPYYYATPARAGAVRVVAASGERLTLATSNGSSFIFDVPSGTFARP